MKKLVLIIFLISLCNINFGQGKLEILQKDKIKYVVFISEYNQTDTLRYSYYDIKIIDTVITDNSISFIVKSPQFYDFHKYFKSDTGWIWSPTSGMLTPNYDQIIYSTIPRWYDEKKKEITTKIIADDKVYLKIGEKETIKDCNDFKVEREAKEREYQEWLKNEEGKK